MQNYTEQPAHTNSTTFMNKQRKIKIPTYYRPNRKIQLQCSTSHFTGIKNPLQKRIYNK